MRIDKIDPPSWFVGLTDNTLQLFVYGEGVKNVLVNSSMGKTKKLISGNSFAVATILLEPDCKDGIHKVSFTKGDVEIVKPYLLQRKNNHNHSRLTSADSIYLIMPDRFAKGKETKAREDLRPNDPNGWHGGNINGIREHLDYIEDLGVTTVWLTPILKNNSQADKGKYYSYHGYAITDYYDVDKHFGTIEDYRLFVKKAHERGLKIVMDVVFNHCGSEHPWNNGASPHTWINREQRKSNYECTTIFGSYTSKYDKEQTIKGWFADIMPDLNLCNDDVLRYLTQMTFWWIEIADIDAIRMDTYLYSDNRQMNRWLKSLSVEYPNFSVIAETWIGNPAYTSRIQKNALSATGKDNPLIVMDFAFQEKIVEAFKKQDLMPLYNHLIYDFLYPNAYQTLAFLDNHDTKRWKSEGYRVEIVKQAIGVLLTIPRIPQLLYGTELLMAGEGKGVGDGITRQDFAIDSSRLFSISERTKDEKDIWEFTRTLLKWRRKCRAIFEGNLIQFLPQNSVYVYFRCYKIEKIMILVNPCNVNLKLSLLRYQDELKGFTKLTEVLTGKTRGIGDTIEIKQYELLILKLS